MILGPNGKPLNGESAPATGTVEIVRSVSFKLNLGDYQSMDFFCSQKATCAADEANEVSASLYDWCYEQVMEAARDVKAQQAKKQAAIAANRRNAA